MIIEKEAALLLHRKAGGKIRIYPTVNIRNEEDLGLAYIQGGAFAASEIVSNESTVYDYSGKGNRLAVISDGSAVLGMGNIGPTAALPVMEGKCLLFKTLGDVNAFPLCIDARSSDEIAAMARLIAPSFGAINIENVSSPNSFTVVEQLQAELDIPVFSDDQHGSAVVVMAALINALNLVEKEMPAVRVVIFGAGVAGIAAARLMKYAGVGEITVLNKCGVLGPGNGCMNFVQEELAAQLGLTRGGGSLEEAARGADVLIGMSSKGKFTAGHISSLNEGSVVMALSMPEPEISVEEALAAGAVVFADGLPWTPNSMPNLHAYPGIARGLLDVRARSLNEKILMAAARAIAGAVDRKRLRKRRIVPDLFSDEVTPRVAEAVAQAAIAEGLAARPLPPKQIYEETWQRLFGGIMVME
ncbi:MAG: NAD(P)-dependent malic enzyme [Aminivibrio sp.]